MAIHPWAMVSLVFLSLYSYLVYPLVLLALRESGSRRGSAARRRFPRRGSPRPSLSLIITAHNEEDRLPDKLANSLALSYPEDRLEIMVASDASTDATDDIVRSHPRVKHCRVEERKGKEACARHFFAPAAGLADLRCAATSSGSR